MMECSNSKTTLRVRVASATLESLKNRARRRADSLSDYVHKIFHYLIYERSLVNDSWSGTVQTDEQVYFEISITVPTKQRLLDWSQNHRTSIAAFSGSMIDLFISKFETDPRDFNLIHLISSTLDRKPLLSELDLENALSLYRPSLGKALPAGYLSRWLYSRLKSLVPEIEKQTERIPLSVDLLDEIVGKLGTDIDSAGEASRR
jgi:hypothetical protein